MSENEDTSISTPDENMNQIDIYPHHIDHVKVVKTILQKIDKDTNDEDATDNAISLLDSGYLNQDHPGFLTKFAKFANSKDVPKLKTDYEATLVKYNLTDLQGMGLLGAAQKFYLFVNSLQIVKDEYEKRKGKIPKSVTLVEKSNFSTYDNFRKSPNNTTMYYAQYRFQTGKVLKICQPPSTGPGQKNPLFNKFVVASALAWVKNIDAAPATILILYSKHKKALRAPFIGILRKYMRQKNITGVQKQKLETLWKLLHYYSSKVKSRKPKKVGSPPGRNYQVCAGEIARLMGWPPLDLVMAHQIAYAWNPDPDVNTLQNLVPGLQSANLFMALFENWVGRLSATNQAKVKASCEKINQVSIFNTPISIAKYGRWCVTYNNITIVEIVYSYYNVYKSCSFFSKVLKACLQSHGLVPKSKSFLMVPGTVSRPIVEPVPTLENGVGADTGTDVSKYPAPLDTLDLSTTHIVTADSEITKVLTEQGYSPEKIKSVIAKKTQDNVTLRYTTTLRFLSYYWDCFVTNQSKNGNPIWHVSIYNPRLTVASNGAIPPMTLGTYIPFNTEKNPEMKPNIMRTIIDNLLIKKPAFYYKLDTTPGLTITQYLNALKLSAVVPFSSIPGAEIFQSLIPNLDHLGATVTFFTSPTFDPKKLDNSDLEIVFSLLPKTGDGSNSTLTEPSTSGNSTSTVTLPKPPPALFTIPDILNVTSLWIGLPYSGFPFSKSEESPNNPINVSGFNIGGTGTLSFANNLPVLIDGYLGGGSVGLTIGAGPIKDPFGLHGFTIDWIELTLIHTGSGSWVIDVRVTIFVHEFMISLSGSYDSNGFNLSGSFQSTLPPGVKPTPSESDDPDDPGDPDAQNPQPAPDAKTSPPPSNLDELLNPLAGILGVSSISGHEQFKHVTLDDIQFSISKSKSNSPNGTPNSKSEYVFALGADCSFSGFTFSLFGQLGPENTILKASLNADSPKKSLTIIPNLVELDSIGILINLASSASQKKTTFEFQGKMKIVSETYTLDIVKSGGVTYASVDIQNWSVKTLIPILPDALNLTFTSVLVYGSDGKITTPSGQTFEDGFGFNAVVNHLPPLISTFLPIPKGSLAVYADMDPKNFIIGIQTIDNIVIAGGIITLLPFQLQFKKGGPNGFGVTASMGVQIGGSIASFFKGIKIVGSITFDESAFSLAIEVDNIRYPLGLGIIFNVLKLSLTFGEGTVAIGFLGNVVFNNGLSIIASIAIDPETDTFNLTLIKPKYIEAFQLPHLDKPHLLCGHKPSSKLFNSLVFVETRPKVNTLDFPLFMLHKSQNTQLLALDSGKDDTPTPSPPWTLASLVGAVIQIFDKDFKTNPPLPPIFEIDTFDLEIQTATTPPCVKFDTSVKLFKVVDFYIHFLCTATKLEFEGGIHQLDLFGLKILAPSNKKLKNPRYPEMAWCKFDLDPIQLKFDFTLAGGLSLFGIWNLDIEIGVGGSVTSGFHLSITEDESFDFLGLKMGFSISAQAALDSHDAYFSFQFDAHMDTANNAFVHMLSRCAADLKKLRALISKNLQSIGGTLEQALALTNSDLDAAQKDADTFSDSIKSDTEHAQHYLDSIFNNLDQLEHLENYHNTSGDQYQKAKAHAEELIKGLVKDFDNQIVDMRAQEKANNEKFAKDTTAAHAEFDGPIKSEKTQVSTWQTKVTQLQVQVANKPSPPSVCGEICTSGIAYLVYLGEKAEWERAKHDLDDAQNALTSAQNSLSNLVNEETSKVNAIQAAYYKEDNRIKGDLKNLEDVQKEIDSYVNPNGKVGVYIQQLESHWNDIENKFKSASSSMTNDVNSLKKNVDSTTQSAKSFNTQLERELAAALKGAKTSHMKWITDLQNTSSYLTDAQEAISVLKILEAMEAIIDPMKWFTLHKFSFSFEAGKSDKISVDLQITVLDIDLPEIKFTLDFTLIIHLMENVFKAVWDALKKAF